MGGAHSQGRARYFAKHIKADNGDKRKRRLIKNGSLRNESARLFPFLIPHYFSTFSIKTLWPSFIPSHDSRLLPVGVGVLQVGNQNWIQRSFLPSYLTGNRRVRAELAFCPSGFSLVAHDEDLLHDSERRRIVTCKHVSAKSQGDGLGKVSQGRCRLSVLSHRRTPQHAKLLRC